MTMLLLLSLVGSGVLLGPWLQRSWLREPVGDDAVSAPADRPASAGPAGAVPTQPAAGSPTAVPTAAAPAATASGRPDASAQPDGKVLRLAGPVPAAGRGTFAYATGRGPLLGRGGKLRSYRVAVEHGSGEDVVAFSAAVERTLAAPGSWIGSGSLRLQRVPDGDRYDFTIYLATAETARRMCAAGGVDIRIGGRPYTSCRAVGKVIINLDRWRQSVDHFVAAKVPLSVYRAYVINHEVGHELGHHHESCPGRGRPAPVMMQQTLFLKGCVANPWPYLNGERYTGPRL